MSRIRVLQITRHLHIGGLERVVANLCRHADPARFEMSVCCEVAKGAIGQELEDAGFEVHELDKAGSGPDYAAFLKVARLLRERSIDLVQSHGTHALIDCSLASLLAPDCAWIHTFHFGNYPHLPQKRNLALESLFSRRAHRLVAVAHAQKRALIDHLRLRAENISVIWNGVDVRPAERLEAGARAAKQHELGLREDEFVLGTVAVMTKQKGIPVLIDAARLLAPNFPRARFLVVGGGPMLDSYRDLCREAGVEDRFVFTGWRTDATELMTLFDIFVMPSLWEAMPMVLLEAMAVGLPTIATRVGDIPRILVEGRTGSLVPPGDPPALADGIGRMISDAEMRGDMGRAAHRRYARHFTARSMAERYERLYLELLGQ